MLKLVMFNPEYDPVSNAATVKEEEHLEMKLLFGAENPQKAWVLTGFDVWEPNPYYNGPPQPHPEDDEARFPEIPARKFTWDGTKGTSFASDLGFRPGMTPTSFTLHNEKRNTRAYFSFHKLDKDSDGDTVSWSFKSTCGKFLVVIFNT